MTTSSPYLGYAQSTVQVLTQNWFGSDGPSIWIYQNSDFWRTPNVVTAQTDLMALTGTTTYLETASNAQTIFYNYFDPNQSPSDRDSPAYYDDEGWWAAMSARLYALTQEPAWLATATQVYLDLQGGWDDVAKGGVWFMRSPKSYPDNAKVSISNELYLDIAMRLYAFAPADSRQPYLDTAKTIWAWLQLLIDDTGLVWGQLNEDATIDRTSPGSRPRPYIQGVVLGGLWGLYDATRDTSYLDAAQQIADAAIRTMVWPDGVLRDLCEEEGTCGPSNLDPPLFKGIYVRYLGELATRLAALADPARQQAAARYAAFLRLNADAVWANYPGTIFGMDWHTPQPNYQPTGVLLYDGSLQSAALDLFIAAAQTAGIAAPGTPSSPSTSTPLSD
jgi:predicted alpha-1,6-mannanase (GH76 family)